MALFRVFFVVCSMQLLAIMLLRFSRFSIASQEGNMLIQVKGSLTNTNNVLKTWNQDVLDPCTWAGVECDNNANIISVNLPTLGLSGTLSSAIGSLPYLRTLAIQNNMISGQLPKELGNLSNLISLKAQNNLFDGVIPSSLGNLSQLKTLDLSGNNLSGQIPNFACKIQFYNFSGNHLDCGSNSSNLCQSSNLTPSTSQNKTSNKKAIVGGIVGAVVFVICVAACIICCERRCQHQNESKQEVFVDVPGFKLGLRLLQRLKGGGD